jgi:hypothetical protein
MIDRSFAAVGHQLDDPPIRFQPHPHHRPSPSLGQRAI